MNMKKMPEIDIENSIHRFVQCDDEAFGEIYEFYFPKIESYIKNRFGFRNESEDLASETLIRIHEAKRKGAFKYRDVKQFGGFLFTIAYRSTLNWIRSIELEVPFESVADDDSEKDQSSEQQIPSTDIDASLNAEYNNELNFLYNQLDIILLGYEENKLKSLAAKLFFEDKCSDDIILRTIKRFNNNIKIQDIKEWLKEKTTLRKIVYDKLYCKREDLMNDLFTFAIEELYTNDQESRILQHYYIECKSVEEIAEDEKLAIEKIQWIIQKLCKTPEEEKILRLHYQFGLPIKRAHDSGVGRGIYIFEYKDINMSADEIYEVINKIDLNKMLTCIMNKVINELTECGLNLDKLK
ncbi:MAG: RNA polymerase sigma factor, partial [bacterium]